MKTTILRMTILRLIILDMILAMITILTIMAKLALLTMLTLLTIQTIVTRMTMLTMLTIQTMLTMLTIMTMLNNHLDDISKLIYQCNHVNVNRSNRIVINCTEANKKCSLMLHFCASTAQSFVSQLSGNFQYMFYQHQIYAIKVSMILGA